MSENIVTINVNIERPRLDFEPVVMTRPTREMVDEWAGRQEMGSGSKQVLIILDDTPREDLENMQDYSYLRYEYLTNYIFTPFWSDDEETRKDYLEQVIASIKSTEHLKYD